MLNFARRVFALRREHAALHAGDIAFDGASSDETRLGLLRFERHAPDGSVVCVFNLGDEALDVPLPSPERVLLCGAVRRTATESRLECNGFLIAEQRL